LGFNVGYDKQASQVVRSQKGCGGLPNPQWSKTMRTEFIECEDQEDAENRAPWAARLVKVEGGWMAFESISDYETWSKQK
jgi:hypothetical protein